MKQLYYCPVGKHFWKAGDKHSHKKKLKFKQPKTRLSYGITKQEKKGKRNIIRLFQEAKQKAMLNI